MVKVKIGFPLKIWPSLTASLTGSKVVFVVNADAPNHPSLVSTLDRLFRQRSHDCPTFSN